MRSFLLIFSIAALALALANWTSAPSARADGLIYALPKNGEQVRYEMEIAVSAGGQDVTTKGSVTVSSVGQTTVDNEKCRWIEIKMINNAENRLHKKRRSGSCSPTGNSNSRAMARSPSPGRSSSPSPTPARRH